MLSREAALAWRNAMASGEYKWGRGMYYNLSNRCHCALGVKLRIDGNFDEDGCLPAGLGSVLLARSGVDEDLYSTIVNLNDNSEIDSYQPVIDYLDRTYGFAGDEIVPVAG